VGVIAYTCGGGRYGPPHPCSAAEYWSGLAFGGVALVIALFTHQGYRYRSGRGSIFGSRSFDQPLQDQEANEEVAGEAMLAEARRSHGLPPDGAAVGADTFGRSPAAGGGDGAGWGMPGAGGGQLAGAWPGRPAAAGWQAQSQPRQVAVPVASAPVVPAVPVAAQPAAPAGWYADPQLPGQMRYWSGTTWAPSGAMPRGVAPPPS